MKKVIAFLLYVVLALGIVMPALAAETTEETTASFAGMDIERIEEEYPDFKKITTKGTFEIPGLRSTPFPDREDCDCMTPQGICVAEDYILITAYCNSYNFVQDILALPDSEQKREWLAREGGHSVHKSVIYVVSKNSYELLNILVLPDDNHVGGIAFDGQLIWIALSKTQKLGVIRFEDLVSTLTNDGGSVEISFYTKVSCDCIASFVTYYDRKLWVGVCDSDNNGTGTMTVFDILGSTVDDLELSGVREFTIPIRANGAAFAQIDGELCLAVNSSYGRDEEKHKSKTHLYSVNFENDYDHGILIDKGLFVLPPMAEEICIDGSDVYTLFESGATPYCTLEGNKCNDVVDRVCIAGLSDWFEWTDSDYQDIEDDYPETEPLIDGMYYNLSDAEDGIYVPNYVTVPDSDKKTETLYNPYTARMALEMSLSAYDLVDADDNDYSWSDSMLKYGYTNIHYFDSGKIMSLGKVIEENGTKKDFFSSVNATLGFKKVRYNGKKKISIVLAFRGTKTWMDGVTDLQIVKDSNGFHDGFAKTAKSCFDSFGEIKLTIDGERVTLADIIESMKDPDSKYCMIVTGHSLGGAVADLFVGHNMYAAGVYPGNVVAYTFAAARSASSDYRYKYTNIFNLVNSDDLVPKLGNDKQIGTNIVYDPDEEFRNKHYPDLLNDVFSAHKLDPVYREIIDIVENDLSQYAPDNVYGFGLNERVNINRNCFCMYEKSVGAKGLGLISANVCINGNLTVGDDNLYMTKDEDYLLIGGDFKTVNAASSYNYLNAGTVELKGDFTDTYSSSFTYGGYREEGTHKTIFSGEGEQRISIDVGKNKNASRFENLVIENPDIYFDTEIYGIRLAADAEITSGTPITVYDHLDLNGYNLKTDGSISITAYYMSNHPNQGQLYTNGGSFDVEGNISCGYRVNLSENDYKCGSMSTAGLNFYHSKLTVSGDTSIGENGIYMDNDEDYLLVGGDFSTISTPEPSSSLSAGTVELKGNFTDTYSASFNYGGYREGEGGAHKTIFSGEGPQRISIKAAQNKNSSKFGSLIIKNQEIYFDTEVYSIRLADDAEIKSGTTVKVYDHLDLNGYDLKTNGGITISGYRLSSNPNCGQLFTNGGSFDVEGNISCGYRVNLSENDYKCGAMSTAGLNFYHSKLTVSGDTSIGENGIYMDNDEDYLLVGGDFSTISTPEPSSSLSAGTVELKGNFTDTYSASFNYGGYREGEGGAHKTIFSGEGPQRISIKAAQNKNSSKFGSLIIKNQEIYFDTEVYSIRLADDAEIKSGTTVKVYDHLDLNGYDLKTNGGITISGYRLSSNPNCGQLFTNGGSFDVEGNISCGYRVNLTNSDSSCGSISTYYLTFGHSRLTVRGDATIREDTSDSGLLMGQEDDYLLVEGNLVCNAKNSSLAGGTIELKGDLTAKSKCYVAGLQHITILSGAKKQTVECWSNYSNKFGTLIIKNESEEGVAYTGKISVGTLFDHNRKVFSIENEAGSSFVDYDGDGKKDNVDRFPTIKDISAEEFIISEVERQPFQGTAIEPEIIVKYGDETLLKDVDYKVSYSGNDRPGTATVSIDGLDNFTGSVAVEFEIYCDHHFGSESTTEPSCTEAGTKTMVCDICGQTVTEEIPAKGHAWNKEYTVDKEPTYTEEGLESIHCSVCGEIKEGTQRPVAKLTKSVSTLSISGITAKTYNGKAQTQAVVVKDGDTTLADGTDYTVTYKDNTNAGTASVIITGIGKYSDSVTKTFTIKKIANTITAKSIVKSYSAQVQTFDLGVKVKNGTPTYKSDNKSVTVSKAGKVTVKAKFIGNANITITSPASTNYTSVTKKIVVKVMPTKTKFTSVTNVATKKMKLTWVKRTNATGYIIQYSTSSTFDSAKTVRIDKYTTVSTTIGNLVKGKKYYVRIKTFKTVSGTKYYSGWSEVMSVKIAK